MKRYHIHTDLQVTYRVTLDGRETDLSQLNLSIYLADRLGAKHEIQGFQTQGSTITFQYRAPEQHSPGIYTLELWLNRGDTPQSVIDRRQAFSLVRYTEQEGGTDDDALTVTPLALLEEYKKEQPEPDSDSEQEEPENLPKNDREYIMVGKSIPAQALQGMKYYCRHRVDFCLGENLPEFWFRNDCYDKLKELLELILFSTDDIDYMSNEEFNYSSLPIQVLVKRRQYFYDEELCTDHYISICKKPYSEINKETGEITILGTKYYLVCHVSYPIIIEICNANVEQIIDRINEFFPEWQENEYDDEMPYQFAISLREEFGGAMINYQTINNYKGKLLFRRKSVSVGRIGRQHIILEKHHKWTNPPEGFTYEELKNKVNGNVWHVYHYRNKKLNRLYRYKGGGDDNEVLPQNVTRVIYIAPKHKKYALVKYVVPEGTWNEYLRKREEHAFITHADNLNGLNWVKA